MEEVGLASRVRVRCFYLGLLPPNTDKGSLAGLLKAFGKVLRLRLARHKGEERCRGYGYLFIELVCSERAFAEGVLAGTPPIYAKEIRGPKHLGSEHTKTLRRCVRAIPETPCARLELLECLTRFGALELEVSECAEQGLQDAGPPRTIKSLFAMFAHAGAIERLVAARTAAGATQTLLARLTVLALLESGTGSWEPPFFLQVHAGALTFPRELSSMHRACPETLIRDRPAEPKDMAQLAFASAPIGSPSPAERRKKHPTMNFEGKRLACTINSNQLSRYSRVLRLLHSGKNLRYNLRAAAPTSFELQTGVAANRRI